jgi:hypothetical protein
MKKLRILIPVGLFLVAGLIFVACQKDAPIRGEKKVMATKTYDFYQGPTYRGTMTYDDQICFGQPTALVFDGFESGKNIKIDYYNTDIEDWVMVENNNQNPPYTAYVTAPNVGTFQYRAKIWNSGFTSFTVQAIECCVTKLEGKAIKCDNGDREAEYKFTYQGNINYVKIQGGLTNWTGDDAVVTVTPSTGYTVNQWTPGGSSNRVISVEGPASCTPLVINVKWNSTNSGGEITGQWTVKDASGVNVAAPVAGLYCE